MLYNIGKLFWWIDLPMSSIMCTYFREHNLHRTVFLNYLCKCFLPCVPIDMSGNKTCFATLLQFLGHQNDHIHYLICILSFFFLKNPRCFFFFLHQDFSIVYTHFHVCYHGNAWMLLLFPPPLINLSKSILLFRILVKCLFSHNQKYFFFHVEANRHTVNTSRAGESELIGPTVSCICLLTSTEHIIYYSI